MTLHLAQVTAAALVCLAAYAERRKGRTPPALAIVGIIAGISLRFAMYGAPGVRAALGGAAIALFPMCLFAVSGGLGFDDVLLIAAVGALCGPAVTTVCVILAAALAGGIALGTVLVRGRLSAVVTKWGATMACKCGLRRGGPPQSGCENLTVSYAVPLAVGLLICSLPGHLVATCL